MSRLRLQARTGEVVHHGRALLEDYVHRFNHHGQDGSAKGNIEAVTGSAVHGVLYELSHDQVQLLEPYEGGYDVIHVEIEVMISNLRVSAYTYISQQSTPGLLPHSSYVEHYMSGMVENDFPQSYVEIIRRQAKK